MQKEEDMFVATCLENNVASQGYTEQEAAHNLKEALELYFEDEKTLPIYPEIKVHDLRIAI
jgi:predicted RNase H-like HicB family nuclease